MLWVCHYFVFIFKSFHNCQLSFKLYHGDGVCFWSVAGSVQYTCPHFNYFQSFKGLTFCVFSRSKISLDLGPQQFVHRKRLALFLSHRYSAKQSLSKLQTILWEQRLSLEKLYPRPQNRLLLGKLYQGFLKKSRVSKRAW